MNTSLAYRIKQRRKLAGLTQHELAEMLNVSQTQVLRYETGQNEPPVKTLIQMSHIFSVSVDWLIGISEDVKATRESSDLSDEELELINIVRGKSPDAARKLIEVAKVI